MGYKTGRPGISKELQHKIIKMSKENPDKTPEDIAKELGITTGTARKYLKKYNIFPVWSLNDIEKKAFIWFLSKGIDINDIRKVYRNGPDFFVKGEPYEIKRYTKGIFLTPLQFEYFKNKYPNTKILIFDDIEKEPIYELDFNDIKIFQEKQKYKIYWIIAKTLSKG